MADLIVVAYQANLTRVMTLMLAREATQRSYPEVGVSDSHHPLSHHADNPEKMARLAKVCALYMRLFAYLVDKMKATPDGDGTLLDNAVLLYGSGMGDPNTHSPY